MWNNNKQRVLYVLFFATGICGLIYQVLWARMFGLVFGNTTFASTTVLAAFMAGLATGSYYSGSYIAKRNDGIRVYAVLELCVGLFGASMPLLLKGLSFIYTSIFRGFDPSFEVLTIIRFILSFIILLIPCTFMGATLPALSQYAADSLNGRKDIIGKLYGINTLGAVIGCFTSGFVLIGNVGIVRTSIIAAVLNVLVAAAAYALYLKKDTRKAETKPSVSKTKKANSKPKAVIAHQEEVATTAEAKPVLARVVIIAYAFSGFAALALEVGWTRALVWVMGMDSYAFASMLSVILAGIGIGSILYSLFQKKIKNDIRLLCMTQFVTGIFVIISIYSIHNSFSLKHNIQDTMNSLSGLKGFFELIGSNTVLQTVISAVILFIPSVLMGVAFPIFANIYIRVKGNVGKGVGNVYSANTMGGIFGSIAMGFFIIPALGLLPSIAIMASIYFLSSIAVFLAGTSDTTRVKAIKSGAALAAAAVIVLTTNLNFMDFLKKTLNADELHKNEKILYFKEHATGGVLVKQSDHWGKEMLIDGVQVASTGDFDLHSHLYPAHLMSLLKKDPEDALIVAFGCGGTSGSMLLYDEIKKLDVVEICNGVVEPAKKYFSDMNRNVFDNPKLNLIIQDGKNYMRMTDKKYDIVYSGPIHPQSNQGSAALYTRDYFEDCKKSLKKGGFQVLWLPLHMSSPEDFKAIVKEYMAVYPHVTLWEMPQTETSASHPHLIGSMEEIYPDYTLIAEKLKKTGILEDIQRLHDTSFKEPYEFISQFSMDEKGLRKIIEGVDKTNTDDLPSVEFYKRPANLDLAGKYSKIRLYQDIYKNMVNPYEYVKNVPEDKKAELKKQLDRLYEGNVEILKGHSLYLTKVNFGTAEFDQYIVDSYRKAYKLIPESTYLKKFFEDNKISPNE